MKAWAKAGVLLLVGFLRHADGYVARCFHLGASRSRPAASGARSLKCDATSPLIEATACRVLRLALRNGREAHVSCSVESDALELLQGRLRGASVKGRDWASRLGLTARNHQGLVYVSSLLGESRTRTIDVDVGNVHLDVGALFRRRSLEFRTPPPSGTAVVVFNASDFGNFLSHKLVGGTVLAGRRFKFERKGVIVNSTKRIVVFGGTWGGRGLRVELSQANPHERLVARVVGRVCEEVCELAGVEVETIALAMSDYFNNLEIDLDGPKLRFSTLSFEGSGVTEGRLKLSLGIVVRKFPNIRSIGSF